MSLLTRCPACTTFYRVVPDQLRISEGWVKCGQCGEIFDASKHLLEADCVPLPTKAPDPIPVRQAALPKAVDAGGRSAAPQFERSSDTDFNQPISFEYGPPAGSTSGLSQPGVDADVFLEIDSDPVRPSRARAAPSDPRAAPERKLVEQVTPERARWDDEVLTNSPVDRYTEETMADDATVSFMQAQERQTVWHKPAVRAVLLLLGLLLGLALPTQWVYLEHDRLAAQHPDLKSALQTFCALAQCQIQPLRHIEALSVDSVGFNKLGKEGYRLSFSIKNSDALPVALPSAELTLTDGQEQPVYRRVLSAKELGATDVQIAAGAEWPVTVGLRVTPEASAQRVFGYRLLVFYP